MPEIITEQLNQLRHWRDDVVTFLKDQRLTPTEWLKQRDDLLRKAPKP